MKKLITTLTLLVFAIAGMNAQEVGTLRYSTKIKQIEEMPQRVDRSVRMSSLKKQKANDHPSGLELSFYDGYYFYPGTFPYASYPTTMNLPELTLRNKGTGTIFELQVTVLINGEPVWTSEEIPDLPVGTEKNIKVDAKLPYTPALDLFRESRFSGQFERGNTVTYRVDMDEYDPHNLEFTVNGSGKTYGVDDGWMWADDYSYGIMYNNAGDEFGNIYVFEEPVYLESVRASFRASENPTVAPMGTTFQVRIHKIDEDFAEQPYVQHPHWPQFAFGAQATHVGENTKIFESEVRDKYTVSGSNLALWTTHVPVGRTLEPGVYAFSVVQPDARYLYLLWGPNSDDGSRWIGYAKEQNNDTIFTLTTSDNEGLRMAVDPIIRPNPEMVYHTNFERSDTAFANAETSLPKEMIFRTLDDGIVDAEALGFFTKNETAMPLYYQALFYMNGGGNTMAGMASKFTATTRDTANRWMILPQLEVGNGDANLYWSAAQLSKGYTDHYSIRLSTTGINPEDFTVLLKEATVTNDSIWQPVFGANEGDYVVDLSPYAGQKVYIAFILDTYDGAGACFANIHVEGVVYNKVDASTKPSQPVVDANVKIYPNPTQDMIYIQAENKIQRVDVFNTLGKVMKTSISATSEINVSDLTPGAYIIRITTDKGAVGYRFIKQ